MLRYTERFVLYLLPLRWAVPSTLQASESQKPRGGSPNPQNPRHAKVHFELPMRTGTSYNETIDQSAYSPRLSLPIIDHGRSATLPVRSGIWCGPWGTTSMCGRRQHGRWASDISQHPKRNPHSEPAGSGVKRLPSEERAPRSEISSYTAASVPTPPRSANSKPPAHRSALRGRSSSSTRLRSSGPCTRIRTPRRWGDWCRRSPDS